MKKKSLVGMAIVTSFALAFLTFAGKPVPVPESGLPKTPIWQITQEGTDKPIQWVDHTSNPRFAIYDPGTPQDPTDDIVLDKETSLLRERSPSTATKEGSIWGANTANKHASSLSKGNRLGWRVPALEELLSLVAAEPTTEGLYLPIGHPFIDIQADFYWSMNGYPSLFCVNFGTKELNLIGIGPEALYYVWCVRGGTGKVSY